MPGEPPPLDPLVPQGPLALFGRSPLSDAPNDPYPGSASDHDYITPDTSPDRATREVLTVQAGQCYETPEGIVVCYASGPADEEDAIDAEAEAALERWRREHVSGEDPGP